MKNQFKSDVTRYTNNFDAEANPVLTQERFQSDAQNRAPRHTYDQLKKDIYYQATFPQSISQGKIIGVDGAGNELPVLIKAERGEDGSDQYLRLTVHVDNPGTNTMKVTSGQGAPRQGERIPGLINVSLDDGGPTEAEWIGLSFGEPTVASFPGDVPHSLYNNAILILERDDSLGLNIITQTEESVINVVDNSGSENAFATKLKVIVGSSVTLNELVTSINTSSVMRAFHNYNGAENNITSTTSVTSILNDDGDTLQVKPFPRPLTASVQVSSDGPDMFNSTYFQSLTTSVSSAFRLEEYTDAEGLTAHKFRNTGTYGFVLNNPESPSIGTGSDWAWNDSFAKFTYLPDYTEGLADGTNIRSLGANYQSVGNFFAYGYNSAEIDRENSFVPFFTVEPQGVTFCNGTKIGLSMFEVGEPERVISISDPSSSQNSTATLDKVEFSNAKNTGTGYVDDFMDVFEEADGTALEEEKDSLEAVARSVNALYKSSKGQRVLTLIPSTSTAQPHLLRYNDFEELLEVTKPGDLVIILDGITEISLSVSTPAAMEAIRDNQLTIRAEVETTGALEVTINDLSAGQPFGSRHFHTKWRGFGQVTFIINDPDDNAVVDILGHDLGEEARLGLKFVSTGTPPTGITLNLKGIEANTVTFGDYNEDLTASLLMLGTVNVDTISCKDHIKVPQGSASTTAKRLRSKIGALVIMIPNHPTPENSSLLLEDCRFDNKNYGRCIVRASEDVPEVSPTFIARIGSMVMHSCDFNKMYFLYEAVVQDLVLKDTNIFTTVSNYPIRLCTLAIEDSINNRIALNLQVQTPGAYTLGVTGTEQEVNNAFISFAGEEGVVGCDIDIDWEWHSNDNPGNLTLDGHGNIIIAKKLENSNLRISLDGGGMNANPLGIAYIGWGPSDSNKSFGVFTTTGEETDYCRNNKISVTTDRLIAPSTTDADNQLNTLMFSVKDGTPDFRQALFGLLGWYNAAGVAYKHAWAQYQGNQYNFDFSQDHWLASLDMFMGGPGNDINIEGQLQLRHFETLGYTTYNNPDRHHTAHAVLFKSCYDSSVTDVSGGSIIDLNRDSWKSAFIAPSGSLNIENLVMSPDDLCGFFSNILQPRRSGVAITRGFTGIKDFSIGYWVFSLGVDVLPFFRNTLNILGSFYHSDIKMQGLTQVGATGNAGIRWGLADTRITEFCSLFITGTPGFEGGVTVPSIAVNALREFNSTSGTCVGYTSVEPT